MKSVCCQDCGEEIGLVHPQEIEERLSRGEYVNRRVVLSKTWDGATTASYQDGVFGICRKCRATRAARPVRGDSGKQAEAQMIRIRDRVALIRERRQDLTLEKAVHAAIEDEFDPAKEPDRAFRAYLLGEGAPKDADVDAKARALIDALAGPHAGGAA